MGGLCINNKKISSQISLPCNIKTKGKVFTQTMVSMDKSKENILSSSQQMKSSMKRKYSKTAEDAETGQLKTSLLKESKKSWKSKRSVKVKETDHVIERRNSEVLHFSIRNNNNQRLKYSILF